MIYFSINFIFHARIINDFKEMYKYKYIQNSMSIEIFQKIHTMSYIFMLSSNDFYLLINVKFQINYFFHFNKIIYIQNMLSFIRLLLSLINIMCKGVVYFSKSQHLLYVKKFCSYIYDQDHLYIIFFVS